MVPTLSIEKTVLPPLCVVSNSFENWLSIDGHSLYITALRYAVCHANTKKAVSALEYLVYFEVLFCTSIFGLFTQDCFGILGSLK